MKIKIISLQKLLKPEAVSNKKQINDFSSVFSGWGEVQLRCFPLQFSEIETVWKWQVQWDRVESVNQNSGIISLHIICWSLTLYASITLCVTMTSLTTTAVSGQYWQ